MGLSSHGFDSGGILDQFGTLYLALTGILEASYPEFRIDFKLRSRLEKLREFLGQATIYRLEAEATTDADMRVILLRLADAWDQLAHKRERLLLRKNASEK